MPWGEAKDAVREANEEAAVKHETGIEVELDCPETVIEHLANS